MLRRTLHLRAAQGNQRRARTSAASKVVIASELKYMLGGLRDDITQTNWRAAAPVGIDEAVGDAMVRYQAFPALCFTPRDAPASRQERPFVRRSSTVMRIPLRGRATLAVVVSCSKRLRR